jgi:YHS domain-containing protein
MSRLTFIAVTSLAVFGLANLMGCNSQAPPPAPQPAGSASDAHADHSHHEHSKHSEGSQSARDQMKAELAKLTPADAASAERQHVCPVSGEMLGTMGPPIKVDVAGKTVWICCDGCKDKLLASPDEYLSKMKEQAK